MTRTSRNIWLCICALAICAICFAVQGLLFHYLENRKARFVSPIYLDITMIRLQNVNKLNGNAVIMGSSMTERLSPSQETAVIGIPSSSFLAGLQVMKGAVSFPPGTTYIIEINNLFNGVYEPVLKETEKWSFRTFRTSRHFSIAAKPANLLLSAIYAAVKPLNYSDAGLNVDDEEIQQPQELSTVPLPTAQELSSWQDIISGIEQIHQNGGKICFACLPTLMKEDGIETYDKACRLARHLNLPVLNYNTDYWRNKLEFTDSRHLNSKKLSTQRFRDVIARDARICGK